MDSYVLVGCAFAHMLMEVIAGCETPYAPTQSWRMPTITRRRNSVLLWSSLLISLSVSYTKSAVLIVQDFRDSPDSSKARTVAWPCDIYSQLYAKRRGQRIRTTELSGTAHDGGSGNEIVHDMQC